MHDDDEDIICEAGWLQTVEQQGRAPAEVSCMPASGYLRTSKVSLLGINLGESTRAQGIAKLPETQWHARHSQSTLQYVRSHSGKAVASEQVDRQRSSTSPVVNSCTA